MGKEICIYCLKKKEPNLFDKEHVIPESFGKFKPNNLTLINTVCKECNSYFGEKLELFLGRDSLEGILRYNLGLREVYDKNIKRFGNKRITFQIDAEGKWKGVFLELYSPAGDDKSRPEVRIFPTVAFYKKDSQESIKFSFDQIKSKKELIEQGFDLKKGCEIFVDSDKDEEMVVDRLKKKGIKVGDLKRTISDKSQPVKDKKIRVLTKSTIDPIILRSVAKISFNYLAKTAGKRFMLLSSFDEIREYIRYGKKKEDRLVTISRKPILGDETTSFRKTDGHLIVVGWGDKNNLKIIGKVSLFNKFTYKIMLCKFFKGIIRKIACGHHFDIHSRQLSRLKHFKIQSSRI